MYAITISKPGGPEVLTWSEVPDPAPEPDEVLIDIRASAVNRADLLQRQGYYPPPQGAPPYPGLECSGTIAALGDGVTDWRVGDEVCALLSGGGYAQKVAVPTRQLLPKPTNTTLEDSAGLPEVACTVWSNVFDLARLKAGETLLVHGGGSGIGTFAIQFARAVKATVITTARQPKHQALKDLGASVTVDYTTEDFVEVTKSAGGADVILDIMGAAYLPRNVEALATGGRLAVIGLQGGRTGELDLGMLLTKRASISATSLRARPPAEKAAIVRGVRGQVWPLIESGEVRPVIYQTFPMAAAAEAHACVEAGEHLGKVLLVNDAAAI